MREYAGNCFFLTLKRHRNDSCENGISPFYIVFEFINHYCQCNWIQILWVETNNPFNAAVAHSHLLRTIILSSIISFKFKIANRFVNLHNSIEVFVRFHCASAVHFAIQKNDAISMLHKKAIFIDNNLFTQKICNLNRSVGRWYVFVIKRNYQMDCNIIQ